MTKKVFEDIEEFNAVLDNQNASSQQNKVNASQKPLKYHFKLDEIPTMEKINLIKSINREIFLGLSIPHIFDDYYDFANVEKSPIFAITLKDKAKLERYFLTLITAVGWREGEFEYWLSFIYDEQDQPLALHENALEPTSFAESMLYLRAISQLFAEIFLIKVETARVCDPILADYAKQELTLGNYLYLAYYNNQNV